MELILNSKYDSTDKDALVVMLDWETDGRKHKYIRKVDMHETIDVSDDLGYAILAKYKGCFSMVEQKTKIAYETKTVKAKE